MKPSLNDPAATGDETRVTVSLALASPLPDERVDPRADDVIARLVAGEARAIDEVYRAHHAALRGFANRFLGDTDVAEDLVHDVFVALPGAIRRFRGDASLRTFLIAIAVKRGYKFMRSASRRRAAMAKLAEHPIAPVAAVGDAPDVAALRDELARALYAALDRLPRDQRIAFALCEIDGMTSGEAAAIVDAPEATVRTRVFHARKKLRELLAEVVR